MTQHKVFVDGGVSFVVQVTLFADEMQVMGWPEVGLVTTAGFFNVIIQLCATRHKFSQVKLTTRHLPIFTGS